MKRIFPWSVFIAVAILGVVSRVLVGQTPPQTIVDVPEASLVYTSGLRAADSVRVISQGRSVQETFSDFVFDLTNGWLVLGTPNALTNNYSAPAVFLNSVQAQRFIGDGSSLTGVGAIPFWVVTNQWSLGDTLGQNAWLTLTNPNTLGGAISLGLVSGNAIAPAGALWLTRLTGPATITNANLFGSYAFTELNAPSPGGQIFFSQGGTNISFVLDTDGSARFISNTPFTNTGVGMGWLSVTNPVEGTAITFGEAVKGPPLYTGIWLHGTNNTPLTAALMGSKYSTALNAPLSNGILYFSQGYTNVRYYVDTDGLLKGDGSALTNISLTNLPANILTNGYSGPPPLVFNAGATFMGPVTAAGFTSTIYPGSWLIPDASTNYTIRLYGNTGYVFATTFVGSYTGNGANITNINANNITNLISSSATSFRGEASIAISTTGEKFYAPSMAFAAGSAATVAMPIATPPSGGRLTNFFVKVTDSSANTLGAGTNITWKLYTNGVFTGLTTVVQGTQYTNDMTHGTTLITNGTPVTVTYNCNTNGAIGTWLLSYSCQVVYP